MGKTGRRELGNTDGDFFGKYLMHLFSREITRNLRDGGFGVLVAIDLSEAIPLTETAKCNLSASGVHEYLTKVGNVYKESTSLCANHLVQPRARGGSISLNMIGGKSYGFGKILRFKINLAIGFTRKNSLECIGKAVMMLFLG